MTGVLVLRGDEWVDDGDSGAGKWFRWEKVSYDLCW
jgi:hypothetical protein